MNDRLKQLCAVYVSMPMASKNCCVATEKQRFFSNSRSLILFISNLSKTTPLLTIDLLYDVAIKSTLYHKIATKHQKIKHSIVCV